VAIPVGSVKIFVVIEAIIAIGLQELGPKSSSIAKVWELFACQRKPGRPTT
jgi:hypothetical protein